MCIWEKWVHFGGIFHNDVMGARTLPSPCDLLGSFFIFLFPPHFLERGSKCC